MKKSISSPKLNCQTIFLIVLCVILVGLFAQFVIKKSAKPVSITEQVEKVPEGTLYDQLRIAEVPNLVELDETVVITPMVPPKDWKKIEAKEFGFELYYPPEWSGFPPENIGEGKPTFMGFCPEPINGSCQDRVPYIEQLNETIATTMKSKLNFEDRREKNIGFRYDQAFSKLDFGTFDGVVVYSKPSNEKDSVFQQAGIYLKIKDQVYQFGFNLDSADSLKVLSSLKEL